MEGSIIQQEDPTALCQLKGTKSWMDGTSVFKSPYMLMMLGIAMNEDLFKKADKSRVTEPFITGLSGCKEIKEVCAVLLTIAALMMDRLKEPIVIIKENTETPVITLDAYIAPDSIGDAHFGQATLCNLMSGAHTCALCCCLVYLFWV